MRRFAGFLAVVTLALVALEASAATPAFYTSRPAFLAAFSTTITDGYGSPPYPAGFGVYTNAAMSAFFNETDYVTTGFANLNIIQSSGNYCAGCNGSFRLDFTTTSLTISANGVQGVGLDIISNDAGLPYVAFITYGDNTTQDYSLPAGASFWGVSAPELIRSIHFGLAGGGATLSGSFVIDNLTIAGGLAATVRPTITPALSLSVPRGATTTNAFIATVFDPDSTPPALQVSATGAPAGIIVANFVLTPTTPAGTYNVTADIIATCDAAPSGTVSLQATDGTPPVATGSFPITTMANAADATLTGGATLCAGENTTLSVALTGTGPWSLTWSDGFVQSGITTSPATRVVSPAVTTTYTITAVSGANGCAGSAAGSALVTVNPRPTATVTGGGTVCAGTVSTVSAALTGTAPWTLTWNDGLVQVVNTSPATREVSPTFNTTFSVVTLADGNCAGGTSTGSAAFVVKPLASAVITAPGGLCASGTGYTASVPDGGPGVTYAWGITGGTITSATNAQTVTFNAPASGTVVLTVTVTRDGCPNAGTKTERLTTSTSTR
ncbi:MAG: hypothetical protein L6R30_14515 [Thermoanaerobaculia bacterium]|nr:hypothetical protein [Thermoanaerobaculia bacterium]